MCNEVVKNRVEVAWFLFDFVSVSHHLFHLWLFEFFMCQRVAYITRSKSSSTSIRHEFFSLWNIQLSKIWVTIQNGFPYLVVLCNMLNGFRGKSGRNGRWPMSPWCDVCENFMTKLFPTFLQCSWYLRYLVPGVMFVKTLWQNQQTCFLPLKFQNVHQRMEASNIFYYMQWYLVPGVMLVKLLKKPADLFLPLKRSSTFKISTGIKPLEICYNFCFLLGTVRQCVCFPLYVQSYWSNWN